jgi:hypothetical protein
MSRGICFCGAGLLGVLTLLFTAVELRAHLGADGATKTLSNVTTNLAGDVTVGTNGSFTLPELSDNVSRGKHDGDRASGSFNQTLVSGGATVRDHNLHLGVSTQ